MDIKPVIARDIKHLSTLRKNGADPIIYRSNEHEVFVFTRSDVVVQRIREGMNWNSAYINPERDGYRQYIYTRLNETQLVDHLKDPTLWQGPDD